MFHLSHVTCHLPCLAYFLSYVSKFCVGTNKQTDATTDIAINGLNGPRGPLCENIEMPLQSIFINKNQAQYVVQGVVNVNSFTWCLQSLCFCLLLSISVRVSIVLNVGVNVGISVITKSGRLQCWKVSVSLLVSGGYDPRTGPVHTATAVGPVY